MPFDVAFYEFLYFAMLAGLGASREVTESHRGGVGGKLTGILADGKEKQGDDLEKLEEAYYKAVRDEKAVSLQMEELDIFPIPKILIEKVKQVSKQLEITKKAFEGAKAKEVEEEEITIEDLVEKMETEKGRLELSAILQSLGISLFFHFNKEGGTGYLTIYKNHEKIWYRQYQYPKTNRGTRAKDMVEKFGFNIIEVMEGKSTPRLRRPPRGL
ncbi:hypothetical protein RHOFW510R12_25050 [Rhodanobacter sp. FW510-R12]|nr:hypothetical protein RHOFW104R8_02615 [Rhodanobacter sp. FW104-R8]KZC28287.1 hypothetical protein RhoFW510T8_11530 [Rhodanobacter sp. FW510-T8]KZC29561.1 hypothetical protein RhoFW510R10_05125 [Rhodanobacter sp. FW510-R10]